jgi:hypothetical protein
VPITKSVKTLYAGMGSSTTSYTLNNYSAAASAATLLCPMGTPQTSPPATGTVTQTGSNPVRQGLVRVKSEASVASFQVTSITGKDAGGATYILFAGEPALTMAGIVDRYFHFSSDAALVEIDVAILPGATATVSLEVVGGG